MAGKKKAAKKAPKTAKAKSGGKVLNPPEGTPMSRREWVEAGRPVDRRPILVDERDGRCDICRGHNDGICDQCGKKIGIYDNMEGRGYQSIVPTHYHLEPIADIQGKRGMFAELCVDCYRKHRAEIYPNETWEPFRF